MTLRKRRILISFGLFGEPLIFFWYIYTVKTLSIWDRLEVDNHVSLPILCRLLAYGRSRPRSSSPPPRSRSDSGKNNRSPQGPQHVRKVSFGKATAFLLDTSIFWQVFFFVVVCIMFVRNDISFGKEYILGKTNHFG